MQAITPSLAAGLRLSGDWGVIVSDVAPGSSAPPFIRGQMRNEKWKMNNHLTTMLPSLFLPTHGTTSKLI